MARKSGKAAGRNAVAKPVSPKSGRKLLADARLYWRVGDWAALDLLSRQADLSVADGDEDQVELSIYAFQSAFMTGDIERGRSLARELAAIPGQSGKVIEALSAIGFAGLARALLMTGQHPRALAAVRASVEMRDDLGDVDTLTRLRIEAERRYLSEKAGLRVRNPMEPRKLFIDCGGYDGCSALMFLLNNPDHDCMSFEPNPIFWEYYNDLPTELVKAAVYTFDGDIEFTIDPVDGDGSTLVEGKTIEFHGTLTNEECPKLNVACIDLSRLVAEKSKEYDSISLKLDIEGAEYDILEKMLADSTLEHIDTLYCEFHGHKMTLSEGRHDRVYSAVARRVNLRPWDAIALSFSSKPSDKRRQKLRNFLIESISARRAT